MTMTRDLKFQVAGRSEKDMVAPRSIYPVPYYRKATLEGGSHGKNYRYLFPNVMVKVNCKIPGWPKSTFRYFRIFLKSDISDFLADFLANPVGLT